MPKQEKREYSPEERATALALYKQVGPAEAGRQLHINHKTISSWAKDAGVQTDAPERTKAAVEAARALNEARKEKLVTMMYERAERILERMIEPEVAHKGQQATRVEYDEATPEALNNFNRALGILIDKTQLLSGGATARTENRTVDALDAEIEKLVAELNSK